MLYLDHRKEQHKRQDGLVGDVDSVIVMMKEKYFDLAGVCFRKCNKLDNPDAQGYDIYDVYDKPSYFKVKAWEEWSRWLDSIHANGGAGLLYITGHNSCYFTIRGWVNVNNKDYRIKITKTYNYAAEI